MKFLMGDVILASAYSSNSQKARVISEAWIQQFGYCLACDSNNLIQTSTNTQARDFVCSMCDHPYELKSSQHEFRNRIVDGAYASMKRRIEDSTVSSFLLLHYTPAWKIANLSLIHHGLITESVVEQRKPLSPTARRSGWIGCNILLSKIPPEGIIPLIVDGKVMPKHESRARFSVVQNLATRTASSRDWTSTILRILHEKSMERFSTQDAYSMELELQKLFPRNQNVKAKIRQQLQVLRDAGLVIFESRGQYRLKTHPESFE